jgi:ornithine cyclodeaminase/alanine dehydrogenase-like protein (mu-crystallin family)
MLQSDLCPNLPRSLFISSVSSKTSFAFISQQTENNTNDSIHNFCSAIFFVSMLRSTSCLPPQNIKITGLSYELLLDVLPHRDASKRGWSEITISEEQVEAVHASEILFTRTKSNVHSSSKTALMRVRLNVRLLKQLEMQQMMWQNVYIINIGAQFRQIFRANKFLLVAFNISGS